MANTPRGSQSEGDLASARPTADSQTEVLPMLMTILLILLILALIGSVPAWPYSQGWGYGPSGLLGTVLVVLLILMLLGRV
jgi:hypothetical protein